MESNVSRAAILVPRVTTPMWEGWTGDRVTGYGTEWSREAEEVRSLLAEIDTITRHMGGWGRRVRVEAHDLAARLAVAETDYLGSVRHLTGLDLTEITTSSLYLAAFGERRPLDADIRWYEEHGFHAGRPLGETAEGQAK